MTLRLGVLCSGEGTNLSAVLDACRDGSLDATVAVVLCNRPGAPCLGRADRAGVPSRVLDHKSFADRAAYDRALADALGEAAVDLVVLAGFMRIVGPGLLDAFPDRVLNVHPSLLPAFPGVDAIGQALAHGARITGCTVHLVDVGTDTGPIVAQSALAIAPGDTQATLAARLHPIEHRTLVTAIGWFARGIARVVREGGQRARVVVDGEAQGRVVA
jgi:phosphoribosylglycinamide formyltransferase-1